MNIHLQFNANASQKTDSNPNVKGEVSLANVPKGSSFEGDILDVRGSMVRIRVGTQILNAILDGSVSVNIGDRLSFLIKDKAGDTVYIKPMMNHKLAVGRSIVNILSQAGLPLQERNVAAVKEMMTHAMPVDRQTMTEIGKLLTRFPEVSVKTLISMKSHNIPITTQNIQQYEAYQNSKNHLSDQLLQFSNELTGMTEKADSIPKLLQCKEVFDKIMQAFDSLKGNVQNTNPVNGNMANSNSNTPVNEGMQKIVINEQILQEGLKQSDTVVVNDSKNQINTTTQGQINAVNVQNQIQTNGMNLQNQMQENITHIKEQIQENPNNTKLQEVLQKMVTDEMSDIKELLSKHFALEPNELAENGEEKLSNLYEKLSKFTEKLIEVLQSAGQDGKNLLQTAQDMKNNMNFMGDLNQMAAYVQVPLKLNNATKTGELYVLNRNKNKVSKDGRHTAFVHLDMDNLGSVDARVSMLNEKVHTVFQLQDEDSMKLIEEHLTELEERLKALGYQVRLETETIKEEKLPFEQILDADKPKQDVKRFAFDVRT